MRMTAVATKEPNVSKVIGEITWKVQAKKVCIYSLASYFIMALHRVMYGKCIRMLLVTFSRPQAIMS